MSKHYDDKANSMTDKSAWHKKENKSKERLEHIRKEASEKAYSKLSFDDEYAGEKLRELRECLDMSQEEFAEMFYTNRQKIGRMEQGISLDTKLLGNIARWADMGVQYFLKSDAPEEENGNGK